MITKEIKQLKEYIVEYKFIKYIVLCLLLFLILFSYVFFYYSKLKQDTYFKVKNGDNLNSIISLLSKENIIYSKFLFKFFMKITFLSNDVKYGDYIIPANSSLWTVRKIITSGINFQYSITIPEGLTIRQIKELLNNDNRLIGNISVKINDGDLIPSTYFFERNTTRNSIIVKMKEAMKQIINNEWNKRTVDNNLIKTKKDAIILASIIEKETSIDSEKPIVSSVIINRLRNKMKLQVDPTVVYAVTDGYGHMRGKALYNNHLFIKNPYNTYLYYGLPKGAICNPGIQSIRAALNPSNTKYLYFVANGKGGHVFSETLDEHEKNRDIWRQYKKQINKK